MSKVNKDKKRRNRALIVFLLAIIIITAVWVVYAKYMLHNCAGLPNEMVKSGAFGDLYGALGALFTGWAFAGVIATMYYQRKNLEAQRESFETECSISKKRDFEYLYFLLLDRQIKVRDRFYFKFLEKKYVGEKEYVEEKKYEGLSAMNRAYNVFCDYVAKMKKYDNEDNATAKRKYIDYIETSLGFSENEYEQKKGIALPTKKISSLEDYYEYFMAIFSCTSIKSYVADLIQICEYVECSDAFDEEKRNFYIRFLGNQLTRIECCVLLFYAFALEKEGEKEGDKIENKRLINYLKEYSLLEQLDRGDVEAVDAGFYTKWLEIKNKRID
jgi:hypothetical protein